MESMHSSSKATRRAIVEAQTASLREDSRTMESGGYDILYEVFGEIASSLRGLGILSAARAHLRRVWALPCTE